jgi:hypothetical protein
MSAAGYRLYLLIARGARVRFTVAKVSTGTLAPVAFLTCTLSRLSDLLRNIQSLCSMTLFTCEPMFMSFIYAVPK